jgi:hypothetical protein
VRNTSIKYVRVNEQGDNARGKKGIAVKFAQHEAEYKVNRSRSKLEAKQVNNGDDGREKTGVDAVDDETLDNRL